jgi:hypothetical protein
MPTNTENRVPQPMLPTGSSVPLGPTVTTSRLKAAVVTSPDEEPAAVVTQGISDIEVPDTPGTRAPDVVARSTGLDAQDAVTKTVQAQLGPKLYQKAQALLSRQNIESTPTQTLQKQWAAFIGEANAQNGGPIDVNALVQWVLRQSYMEQTQDLEFYAQKVQFYNNLKQAIRNELTKARQVRSNYAGASNDTQLNAPYQEATFEDHYTGQSTTGGRYEGNAQIQAYEQALSAAQTGGGVSQVSSDQSGFDQFKTAAGYSIYFNKSQNELRIYSPNGTKLTDVWGDPHVTQEDGSNFNFANGSTFVLPDGTKICLTTRDVGNGTYALKGIDILSGSSHAADGLSPEGGDRSAKVTDDRVTWDAAHADTQGGSSGGVFALEDNGRWAIRGADGQFSDVANAGVTGASAGITIQTDGAARGITSSEVAGADDGLESGAMSAEKEADNYAATTVGGLDTYIQNLEDKLNSVGDDAQLANVDLQDMLQKQQATLQLVSNISKMLYDTAMAVIRKIGS